MNEPKDRRTKSWKEWKKSQTNEGLGDKVEKILSSPIVKPVTQAIKKLLWKDGEDCGCEEKRKKLNFKFPSKLKPRCLKEHEYIWWGKYQQRRKLKVEQQDIEKICRIYSDVFKRLYYEPCRGCSPKPLLKMIEMIDRVYKTYQE